MINKLAEKKNGSTTIAMPIYKVLWGKTIPAYQQNDNSLRSLSPAEVLQRLWKIKSNYRFSRINDSTDFKGWIQSEYVTKQRKRGIT